MFVWSFPCFSELSSSLATGYVLHIAGLYTLYISYVYPWDRKSHVIILSKWYREPSAHKLNNERRKEVRAPFTFRLEKEEGKKK